MDSVTRFWPFWLMAYLSKTVYCKNWLTKSWDMAPIWTDNHKVALLFSIHERNPAALGSQKISKMYFL